MSIRWVILTVGLGVIILVNYILLRQDTNFNSPPEYKNMFSGITDFQACCNPLFCPMEGAWMMRNDITYGKLSDVLNTNMQLRIRKGWPTSLFHGDLRCGKRYPLPRILTYNNSKGYYSDIVSQCDGFGRAPCCKENIGWCGQGPWFCDCDACADYSTVKYAELYTWIHIKRCQYLNFESNQSCAYLRKVFSSITFIGDSLVRHVFSSLLLHLTGDNIYGALKVDSSERDLQFCSGENQFVDSSCHVKLATKWNDIKMNPKYCPFLKDKLEISFVQAYNSYLTKLALQSIAIQLKKPNPLILVGIGIHENFNASKVITNYMNPILQLIRRTPTSKPLLVWLNTHSAGPLKPLTFQATQGNSQIKKFNNEMNDYCYANSIIVFDTFNITKGVHSFDGTHYGSALNKLKVKLLINGLVSIPSFGFKL